ncbi:hypothetical protein [Brevibacterium oceani]|uniref:hypothetical protein n=1 Tax=Brevibacterium oceani TaxID=358099 RepID=UPI001B3192BD|nr:hypothetical protein [Brevibacterium oceani]
MPQSESNASSEPLHGLRRALMALFKVLLVAFLVLGSVLVIVQLIGVIIGGSSLVVGVVDALALPTTVAASAAGLLGFAMSYIFHWKSSD